MTATNHALTGAFIGLTISTPAFALPIAFLSHFVCDALPHYDSNQDSSGYVASSKFAKLLTLDALLCVLLVIVLVVARPQQWFLAAICAFVATLPDFAWLPGYVRTRHGQPFKKKTSNWFMDFAAKIQWFAKPIGGFVELAWFVGLTTLIAAYL